MPAVSQAFETIAMAKVAKSAMEARDLLFLRPEDGITMNRDRLLADAKAKALELARNYKPPQPVAINLPGATARAALGLAVGELQRQGKATAHDGTVAGVLAEVLSGGDTDMLDELSEDQLLALERRAFMGLLRNPRTLARMEHMLETGKPLRT
jgi:3-hydroxyacyl-CoA dehydrogenase